jgi:hypothetical protein
MCGSWLCENAQLSRSRVHNRHLALPTAVDAILCTRFPVRNVAELATMTTENNIVRFGNVVMRSVHVFLGFLALGVLALGAPAFCQAPAQSTLLIRGATVIDGLLDAPLLDRSLLIEGNVIRDILPADAIAPAGTQVVNLGGKFIIPGLFDSHVHWEEYMGELYINHGVTSVVSLDNVPKALRVRSQEALDIPRFFHPGGRLLLPENATEADIRQMVRNSILNEPDFAWFSQYNARNARAYAIAADEAHKAGFLIFGHTDDAPGSVRDGMDIIEHIWGFGEATMSQDELRSFREGKLLTLPRTSSMG